MIRPLGSYSVGPGLVYSFEINRPRLVLESKENFGEDLVLRIGDFNVSYCPGPTFIVETDLFLLIVSDLPLNLYTLIDLYLILSIASRS